jgi:hypothetical protein
MSPARCCDDPAPAALIADICDALHDDGLSDEKMRLAAGAAVGARTLDARLAQIQATLERIDVRLAAVEHELADLIRPSWPF